MTKLNVINIEGKEVGEIELADSIFNIEVNEHVLYEAVKCHLANRRQGTQSAKTRAEVRGGGRKPWRQKGTGRARQGSIRSPQWIKGGVAFAPKPRDFSQKINKQMKRLALKSALSAKVADGNFIALDKIVLKENKTKEVAQILKNFKIEERVLLVLSEGDDMVVRAAKNIPSVLTIDARLLNVYDVVSNAKVVATENAIKKIEEVNA